MHVNLKRNRNFFQATCPKRVTPSCTAKHIDRLDRTHTFRDKHGRETAKPKATTRVIADTAAPAYGG